MVSISRALQRIKGDLDTLLSETYLSNLAREAGCRWRERCLGPAVTIQLFVLQILHGNICCAHAPRLGGRKVSGSGYCQARMRLPLRLLKTLVRRVADRLQKTAGVDGRWHGHRTFLIDGSSCSMPDTPALQKEFGQPTGQRKGCGFPVAHLLALFDAHAGTLLDVLMSSWRIHDLNRAAELHAHLQPGDLLLADRGFCSYAHLTLLSQQKVHVVFRLHQRQIVDFTPHRAHATSKAERGKPRSIWLAGLGGQDQVVMWRRPKIKARWMTAEEHARLPEDLVLRELRYRVGRPGFRTRSVTLVTTLLDPEVYPAEDLAELYASRWQIEVNLRHLKETMGMKVLHSQTVDGVRKELLVFALVYNLVRAVMHETAIRHKVEPDRVSFIDAWRWLRHPWDEPETAGDEPETDAQPPPVIINPLRPGRYEPRVRKRRPPEYPVMTKPRAALRKTLLEKSLAA
jgi:hypothetical protein